MKSMKSMRDWQEGGTKTLYERCFLTPDVRGWSYSGDHAAIVSFLGGRFQEVAYESVHSFTEINFYFFWHMFIQNYSSESKWKKPLK